MGKELNEEEDGDTWKDDTETGEEPVLKKNSLDAGTAAAAEDDVLGFRRNRQVFANPVPEL